MMSGAEIRDRWQNKHHENTVAGFNTFELFNVHCNGCTCAILIRVDSRK